VDLASSSARESIPLRRIVLWTVVALAVVLGIVLYFIYEPRVATLIP
jgi:type VI protein secretion system component VasF